MKKNLVLIATLALGLVACEAYNARDIADKALAEISPARVNMEVAIMEGKTPTFSYDFTTNNYIFLGIGDGKTSAHTITKTTYCHVEIVREREGVAIVCLLGEGTEQIDNKRLIGKSIVLARTADEGIWGCVSNLDDGIRPASCEKFEDSEENTQQSAPENTRQNAPRKTFEVDESNPESVTLAFLQMAAIDGKFVEALRRFHETGKQQTANLSASEMEKANNGFRKILLEENGCIAVDLGFDSRFPTEIQGDYANLWPVIECANGKYVEIGKSLLRKKNGKWLIVDDKKMKKAPVARTPQEMVNAALAEISPGRTNMEVAVSEGKIPTFNPNFTDNQHIYMGIGDNSNITSHATTTKTTYCGLEIFTQSNGAASIVCSLGKGSTQLNKDELRGKSLIWARNSKGDWTCLTDVAQPLRPRNCFPIQ